MLEIEKEVDRLKRADSRRYYGRVAIGRSLMEWGLGKRIDACDVMTEINLYRAGKAFEDIGLRGDRQNKGA